jgi:hypothetical protein
MSQTIGAVARDFEVDRDVTVGIGDRLKIQSR